LFEQVASLGNLFAAAKRALRGRGLKMPAVAFAADLETIDEGSIREFVAQPRE
ncbi:MAG: hypothetical protein RLZZ440_1312, partial [Planctomycetota bacterium]